MFSGLSQEIRDELTEDYIREKPPTIEQLFKRVKLVADVLDYQNPRVIAARKFSRNKSKEQTISRQNDYPAEEAHHTLNWTSLEKQE